MQHILHFGLCPVVGCLTVLQCVCQSVPFGSRLECLAWYSMLVGLVTGSVGAIHPPKGAKGLCRLYSFCCCACMHIGTTLPTSMPQAITRLCVVTSPASPSMPHQRCIGIHQATCHCAYDCRTFNYIVHCQCRARTGNIREVLLQKVLQGLEHETHQQHTQQHQQQHQIQPQQQAAASSKPGGQESAGKPPQPATLAAPPEEVKMVLCVDVSLGMGKAKLGGHIARATVGLIQKYRGQNDELLRMWEESGQAKILRVKDEPEMEQLADQALQNNLPFYMAHHTGTTKTRENLETVKTVLAIGPAYKSDIDKITGHLSLL
eukprot:GHUV01009766.1.p1 GENE.GHUV01009766.1~~GHUV01009766.1.p1  ORF type:complete len:319 (+),score=65.73 GHUV01009766.1:146-1102(+)